MIYLIIAAVVLLGSCTAENRTKETPSVTAAVTPSVEPIKPENAEILSETPIPDITPTAAPVDTKSNVVAEFTTPLIDKGENRVHNIKLASRAVNGYVLKDGAEFSFNKIVGERSSERGYKTAPVLVGTEHTEGLGGGVCQTAASVYNAALRAGMNITEHHTHKIEVAYAPHGTDATVNYDDMDLRFKNNLGYDVKIEIKTSKNNVSARIVKI